MNTVHHLHSREKGFGFGYEKPNPNVRRQNSRLSEIRRCLLRHCFNLDSRRTSLRVIIATLFLPERFFAMRALKFLPLAPLLLVTIATALTERTFHRRFSKYCSPSNHPHTNDGDGFLSVSSK